MRLQVLQPDLLLIGEFAPMEVRVQVSAPQAAASLDLSVRSAATGAAPIHMTMLAALPDGKLHEVSLESQALSLPKLPPGATWTQQLWVRSSTAQDCRVTAVLSCPALVTAHADVRFQVPFEHRVRLCAEAGVHTLAAPSTAFAVVNGSDTTSYGALHGKAADAAGVAAGSSGSVDSGADAVPLVVGQGVLAQVLVAARFPVDLLLQDASLEQQQQSSLKVRDGAYMGA